METHFWFKVISNLLQELVPFVEIFTNVAMVALTFWLGRLTKTLSEETKKTREINMKAEVVCFIGPHAEHLNIIEVKIENIGKAQAQQVEVAVEIHSDQKVDPKTSVKFSSFNPGSHQKIYAANASRDIEKVVRVEIKYRDELGQYSTSTTQKIEDFKSLTKISSDPSYKIAAHVETIASTLTRIVESNALKVDVYDNSDRVAREIEIGKFLQEQSGHSSNNESI